MWLAMLKAARRAREWPLSLPSMWNILAAALLLSGCISPTPQPPPSPPGLALSLSRDTGPEHPPPEDPPRHPLVMPWYGVIHHRIATNLYPPGVVFLGGSEPLVGWVEIYWELESGQAWQLLHQSQPNWQFLPVAIDTNHFPQASFASRIIPFHSWPVGEYRVVTP